MALTARKQGLDWRVLPPTQKQCEAMAQRGLPISPDLTREEALGCSRRLYGRLQSPRSSHGHRHCK
jgi:hypothetical protein